MSRLLWCATLVLVSSCAGGSGAPAASSLAGTWDVTATGNNVGDTGTLNGVVTIDANDLVVSLGNSSLTYHLGDPTFQWTGDDPMAITTTHTAAAMDVGAFAFPLGGSWSFASEQDPSANCSATFSPTAINATGNLDYDLDSITNLGGGPLTGSLVGLKSQAASSIFGDLGGTWNFADGNGNAIGTITFSGSTVAFSMTQDSGLAGTFSLTFNNGVATGSSNTGVEVVARQR